ncbi:MAG: hypothetical protein ACFFBH_10565 [Promethearchaeota archaeon]
MSLIKRILFLILIGIHAVLFVFFLIISNPNLLLTTLESSFFFILVSGALYTFFIKNPYYLQFYIGIIVATIVVAIVIPISLVVLIPELIFLIVLATRGPSSGQIYINMKASKQERLPYYDQTSVRMYNMFLGPPTSGTLGFRMDEIWNPDSNKSTGDEKKELYLKKKYMMWKITVISLFCTIGFLTTSIMSLILHFL